MNTFPLSRPLTLDEFVKGYADGGEVESIMPTGEDEYLFEPSAGPEDTFENLAQKYDIPAGNIFVEGFTPPAGFTAGEGDPQAAQRLMASLSLMDPSALQGLMATSFADPNAAATARYRSDTRAGIGSGGSMYEEGAIEAAKASAADPTKGIWERGFQQLLAEDPEATRAAIEAKSSRDLEALAKVEADYAVMKPLSDLLKANRFKEAFELAKDTGSIDKLMDTNVLRELRPAFSQQEMRDFFAAVPPEWGGKDYDFKPDAGIYESMDPYGTGTLMEAGYPDPTRAFKRKDDPMVKNLVIAAGLAMLTAGIAPVFSSTAQAATSAAGATGGAGAGAAGAGAASTGSGFLTGLKTAATKILGVPEVIGTKIGEAFGANALSSLQAKMIGNAVISGGVTGAKGGDLEDVIKSAALAAGLTYVSDKAIKAVAGNLQKSGVLETVKEIPGGDVTAVDPSVASNVADKITQNLDKVTVVGSKALDLAQQVGGATALGASQALAQPKPQAQLTAPEDEIAAEYTQTYEKPLYDFGAGLETGLYTGRRGLSFDEAPTVQGMQEITQTAAAEKPVDVSSPLTIAAATQAPITKQPAFVEAPTVEGMQEIKQTTTGDDYGAGLETGLFTGQRGLSFDEPFVEAEVVEGLPEVKQTTTQEKPDIASPLAIAAGQISYKPPKAPFIEAPTVEGMQEITQTADKLKTGDIDLTKVGDIAALAPSVFTEGYRELPKEKSKTEQEIDKIQDALKTGAPIPGTSNRFLDLLKKYGTVENILKVAGAVSGLGGTKEPPTGGGAGAVYDPRTSAGAGVWIDWEKVKAEADAAGMNLNTYTARNWNKIQNRALEAGAPQAVAPEASQGYNFPGSGLTVNPQGTPVNFDLLKYLEDYQPEPKAYGGMAKGSKVRGPGHGREDLIPALLSDGEYVIDAETMALLGNGSTDAGAKMMDGFRENIRKHKGAKLAKGGISPDAKSPLQYLRGA